MENKKHKMLDIIKMLRRLSQDIKRYKRALLFLFITTAISSSLALLSPLLTQKIVDDAYPNRDFHLLFILCGSMLLIAISVFFLKGLSGYIKNYVFCMLRFKYFTRMITCIQNVSPVSIQNLSKGYFVERATTDIDSVSQGLTQIASEITEIVFTLLVAFAIMLKIDFWISILILAVFPLNYLLTYFQARKLRKIQVLARKLADEISTFIMDNLAGVEVLKIFSLSDNRKKKIRGLNRERLKLQYQSWRTRFFWGIFVNLNSTAWGILILTGGWYLVFIGHLNLGEAIALGLYLGIIARPFTKIGSIYQRAIDVTVSQERVDKVINDSRLFIKNSYLGIDLKGPIEEIRIKDLNLSLDDKYPILRDVNLTLNAGEKIVIVGPNGAGKSSLLRVLAGIETRWTGDLTINGWDFNRLNIKSYWRQLSMVPQQKFFFNDTIAGNIYPPDQDLTIKQVDKKAKILAAYDTIHATEQGYDSILGTNGILLSSGQYQKLAMLRAMLKDSSLLLLDEMTVSMDVDSERKTIDGMISLIDGKCITLVVTHNMNLTTEKWVDRIIVMKDGYIHEFGSNEELYDNKGFYYSWLKGKTISQ